jgi:tetratricopeptide (TPR) repeat protein
LRRELARFSAAAREGDPVATRAAGDELKSLVHLRHQHILRSVDAIVFELEERWSDCLATTKSIDTSKVGSVDKLMIDDLRARSLAHLGRAEEALPMARAVVDEARRVGHPRLERFVHTLGTAQLKAGDPASALASFDAGIAAGAGARVTERVAFHRGEALRALGRIDDARGEYERAIEARPESSWGRRAQERLINLADQPYRE